MSETIQNRFHISPSAARMLEWPEFLQYFSGYASSAAGRQKILELQAPEDLKAELEISHEALQCALKDQIPSLSTLENSEELIHKAAIENQVMDGAEILHLLKLIALNNEVRNSAEGWNREFPRLFSRMSHLPDLKTLEREIDSVIDPTGELKEDATPELARLYKQTSHLKTRVERALERYFRDSRYQGVLQEDYVTYRHGRAVLLARSEQKQAIRGVVHGISGSGASVFLEPFNVLELNNELAELNDQIREEITRILKQLTASIARNTDALLFSLQQLTVLDTIFARGRFGKFHQAAIPEMTSDFHLRLIDGRHPLLEAALKKENRLPVPLSLEMPPDKKALVVTGPNTGGKTVFLKTAGLLTLMAHHALPVPAAEGTKFPIIKSMEADIGDQQSISESLSTFSSHIRNIRNILEHVQERSIVLLDELGTGTDPEEGAPLAVAILEEFLKRDTKTLITSHHSQMKVFAFNHPQCLTAAMEFDQNNLQPTYRVHLDQVGASHAFEIAERLGLPSAILKNARSLVGDERRRIDEFQRRLQEKIHQLTIKQEELEREKAEWESKANEQQQKLDALQNKLEQELRTLREQNADLIRTMNAKVEVMLDSIKDAQERQALRKQLKEEVMPAIQSVQQLTAVDKEPEKFNPGERVWVNLYKDFGEIISIKKEQAEVLIRNIRFTVPLNTLERKQSVQETLPKGVHVVYAEKNVEPELNLIGQTVDEALSAADKYLDDAVLGQLPQVRLIHGHGTGKLKRALEEMLTSHPHVRGFHPESPQRGGTGVTVVELKAL